MFKRTQSLFTGGDVTIAHRITFVPQQRIAIVGIAPGTDPDDDLYKVRMVTGDTFIADGCDLSPHPDEPELNTEFVERIMTTGSPLMQGFILQAVEQFAKAVLSAPAKSEAEDTGMITDAAWRECAQFTLGNFVARDVERKERNSRRQFA